jgi:hypothetical protein
MMYPTHARTHAQKSNYQAIATGENKNRARLVRAEGKRRCSAAGFMCHDFTSKTAERGRFLQFPFDGKGWGVLPHTLTGTPPGEGNWFTPRAVYYLQGVLLCQAAHQVNKITQFCQSGVK